MSKLANLQKFRLEDFPDPPSWLGKFITTINSFFETIYYTVAGQITFQDNIKCQIYTNTIAGNAFPHTFKKTLAGKITGIAVVKMQADDGSMPTNGFACRWESVNDSSILVHFTTLQSAKTYIMTLLIF